MRAPHIEGKKTADDYQVVCEVELPGSPEEIWDLLTTSEGVSSWFAPNASIDPKLGGVYAISWRDSYSWIDRIEEIEPGKRLLLKPWTSELEGMDFPVEQTEEPFPYALEYTLAGKGGSTVVRLVQSGFLSADSWEDEVDSYLHGWRHQFFSLAHWMTRHKGESRTFVRGDITASGSKEEIWAKLTGEGSVFRIGRDSSGNPSSIEILFDGGLVASGELLFYKENRQLIANLSDRGDSLFAFGLWSRGGKEWLVSDMNFYGRETQAEADQFAEQLKAAYEAAL